MARRPAVITAVGVVLLGGLVAGSLQLKQDYESLGSPQPGTEAATWYDEMKIAFPAGLTTPTHIYVHTDSGTLNDAAMNEFASAFDKGKVEGVDGVQPMGQDAEGNPVLWTPSQDRTIGRVTVLLRDNPYSTAAMDVVREFVRPKAHDLAPSGTRAEVGGLTSVFVDVAAVTSRDLRVIFPVAGALILIILMVLLRAMVAPVYLMITTHGFSLLGVALLAMIFNTAFTAAENMLVARYTPFEWRALRSHP